MTENRHTVETSGPNAVEAAKSALQSYDFGDKEVMEVSVEVVVENGESEQKSDGGSSGSNWSHPTNKDRELQELSQPNTQKHFVLWLVGEVGPATNEQLAACNGNDDLLELRQIQTAASRLYAQKLLEREKEGNGDWRYKYRLSKYGEGELDRLGEPDRDEVVA